MNLLRLSTFVLFLTCVCASVSTVAHAQKPPPLTGSGQNIRNPHDPDVIQDNLKTRLLTFLRDSKKTLLNQEMVLTYPFDMMRASTKYIAFGIMEKFQGRFTMKPGQDIKVLC